MKRLVLVAFAATLVAPAYAVVWDNFADGANGFSIQSGTAGNITAATVPGGSRFLFGSIVANTNNQFLDASVSANQFVVSNGFGTSGQVVLGYGINTFTPPNSVTLFDLNSNLSAMGDRFRLNFIGNDLPMQIEIDVLNNLGAVSSVATANVGANASPFSFDVLFSSFIGSADFSSADQVLFGFNTSGTPNHDFALRGIEVVPEPATLAALGIGAAAILRRRRK